MCNLGRIEQRFSYYAEYQLHFAQQNNNCSQNEEMKAQILDKYKEACLYCHSSHYGEMSLLSQKNILVDAIFCILLYL